MPRDAQPRLHKATPTPEQLRRHALARSLFAPTTLPRALEMEYRYTHRAQEQGDFLEGIRAAVIDKDRAPRWLHASIEAVSGAAVAAMLMPLGAQAWTVEKKL